MGIDYGKQMVAELDLESINSIDEWSHCGIELVKEIDVAAGGVELAARGGAEKLQPLHSVMAAQLGNLRAMWFDPSDHAVEIMPHVLGKHVRVTKLR